VAGSTLVAGAGAAFAVTSWPAPAPAAAGGHHPAGIATHSRTPGVSGSQPAATASRTSTPTPSAKPRPRATPARRLASTPRPTASPSPQATVAAAYLNPFRDVSGLVPERVDMGVDFAGSGSVYALGNAVITNATGDSAGWPGGGWITYQLTSGPASGIQVYVAEDVKPTVQVGQHVTSSTVIADMYEGGDGIETGWAMPDGSSAESQLPVAGGISGGGPFPTDVGLNFDQLLVALGAPAAPNAGEAGNGILPTGYPTNWTTLLG
jgi:hypothetical protein